MKKGQIIGVVIGIVMIIVGYGADMMGIGPNPGTGWKQISLMACGAILIGASIFFGRAKS